MRRAWQRLAHGHTPDVDGPITYELMAQDTIAFLEAVVVVPRTWSATATARSWRCWSPCAVPIWPGSWS